MPTASLRSITQRWTNTPFNYGQRELPSKSILPSPGELDEHRTLVWGELPQCLPEELDVRLLLPASGIFRNSLQMWNDTVNGWSYEVRCIGRLAAYNSTQGATFSQITVHGQIVLCAVVLQTKKRRPHRQQPSSVHTHTRRTSIHANNRQAANLSEAGRPRRGTRAKTSTLIVAHAPSIPRGGRRPLPVSRRRASPLRPS